MSLHDWTRTDEGSFNDFYVGWITALRTVLNNGLLPSEFYARAEQVGDALFPRRSIVVRRREDQGSETLFELVFPSVP
jgi:hypothetical protein